MLLAIVANINVPEHMKWDLVSYSFVLQMSYKEIKKQLYSNTKISFRAFGHDANLAGKRIKNQSKAGLQLLTIMNAVHTYR